MSNDDFPLPDRGDKSFFRIVRQPANVGLLANPSCRGAAVGQCGDSLEVFLRVEAGRIVEVGVVPHGCAYTLACASAMSELAKGLDLESALELEPADVVAAVGELPEDHLHCARLAVNTLGEAIAEYYRTASGPASDGSGKKRRPLR